MAPPLPPPDPQAANAASVAADNERREALDALSDPAMTYDLAEFFDRVNAEKGGKHVLGHTHIRAALEALPHIGYRRSVDILNDIGLSHNRHVDTLGKDERDAILAKVAEFDPRR